MRFTPSFVTQFSLALLVLVASGCSSNESSAPSETSPYAIDSSNDAIIDDLAATSEVTPSEAIPPASLVAPLQVGEPAASENAASKEEPLANASPEEAQAAKEKWADRPSLLRSLGGALGRGVQKAISDKKEESAAEESAAEENAAEENAAEENAAE